MQYNTSTTKDSVFGEKKHQTYRLRTHESALHVMQVLHKSLQFADILHAKIKPTAEIIGN